MARFGYGVETSFVSQGGDAQKCGVAAVDSMAAPNKKDGVYSRPVEPPAAIPIAWSSQGHSLEKVASVIKT
ncbi:hypothetical protein HPB50_008112 [Hyalomma asiaticum]|uniref:Uncharacterized protein n=1 Tax=Hyalomma asiaticum TaxID=266040 RepID=A0ACB7S7L7_HYAAI|nr:hypothetical protein HPB50_008112 [Hyalomma asiaticum]